jgi:flagellar biosynthesis protein FliQ
MREWWQDFLRFKQFITPAVMPVVFWVGVAIAVIMGVVTIVDGARIGAARLVVTGLVTLLAGPLFVRILCELVMTFFRQE